MSYLSKIAHPINNDEFVKIHERFKNLRRTNEISFLRKTLEFDRIEKRFNPNQGSDSPKIKELRRVLAAMEKADAELDVAESKLSEMKRLGESKTPSAETIRKEALIEAQQKIEKLEKKLQQTEEAYKKAISRRSNGANKKNEPTNNIKLHVIKPIFTAKKKESPDRKISEISISILKEMRDLNEKKFKVFAEKYSIKEISHLKAALSYIESKEDGGQVPDWCYKINKGKL